ncbi:hypothetical protein [Sphingobacterium anhuiense]|uniref:RiboL-PSP-HEPN domain-containing protein n=1 Tax=Sphingobacterium anhuiense TaxID=493780 RepID=A0ABW5YVW8_9SPHI
MDKLKIYENKLTPSAKEALKETMTELEDLMICKANSIAQIGQTADREISLRDILEAKESLFKAKLDRDKADDRRKKLMTITSLTGALYALIGIFIYLYQNQEFILEKNLGLIISFTGIVTVFVGFAYNQFINRRQEQIQIDKEVALKSYSNDFEIIKRWQIIEKLASALMSKKGYTLNESRSINDILKFLSLELKSDELYLETRELLSVRNRILHEGYELGKNEKQTYIDNANKIIELLETLVK